MTRTVLPGWTSSTAARMRSQSSRSLLEGIVATQVVEVAVEGVADDGAGGGPERPGGQVGLVEGEPRGAHVSTVPAPRPEQGGLARAGRCDHHGDGRLRRHVEQVQETLSRHVVLGCRRRPELASCAGREQRRVRCGALLHGFSAQDRLLTLGARCPEKNARTVARRSPAGNCSPHRRRPRPWARPGRRTHPRFTGVPRFTGASTPQRVMWNHPRVRERRVTTTCNVAGTPPVTGGEG